MNGLVPWNKSTDTTTDRICTVCGEKFHESPSRVKSGKGKFCSKKCFYRGRELKGTFQKGHPIIGGAHSMPHTEETKNKIRAIKKLNPKRGADVWNWKGGAGTFRHQEMGRVEYKEWRVSVFKRDNYLCQDCGNKNIYLHADHKTGWSEYESKRYDVSNGITLCYRCHYKKTFPKKKFNELLVLKWGVPKKYRKEVSL